MTTTTAEWLLEIGGLTVGASNGAADDVVAQGHRLAEQVQGAAALVLAHNPCTGVCDKDCLFYGLDGGAAACRLSRALANGLAPPAPANGKPQSPQRAVATYIQALRAASTAVFHCRRCAHPAGECWFSHDGRELCGDVLAVAHRVSA